MKKKVYLVLTIIAIVIISILMASRAFQNDTFYTIKIGEGIFKYGVDMIDHFSFHNLSYTYPHWLYDVMIYKVYDLFDFKGLYIYNIICYIILGLLFFYVNLNINKKISVVAVISILFTVMIRTYVVVRAQSVTYILFLLEILFIRKLLDNGKYSYLIGLLFISLLICNIHVAVWPMYFILFLPYIGEFICSKIPIIKKFLGEKLLIKKEKNIKKLFVGMGISLFTGLFTPLRGTSYSYFVKTALGNSQKYILEHQFGFNDKTVIIGLIIGLFLLLFLLFKTKKIRITDVFMILGLTLMAIMSQRHFALYILLGMISFTSMFVRYLDRDSIFNLVFDSKIFFIIVIIEIVFIACVRFMVDLNKEYVDSSLYPVEGVKYLKDNFDCQNIKIFNDYNFGSYLMLNDIKVFIDSRADLYTREFSGLDYDIFDDYMDISDNYDMDKLDNYNIDLIFIYRGTYLDNNLRLDNGYNLIYEDDYFVIYDKR